MLLIRFLHKICYYLFVVYLENFIDAINLSFIYTAVVISVVIVTAVVIVTKIVTKTVIAIGAAVETVTTIVILYRVLNVSTWLREITLYGLWRVHLK